MRLPSLSCDLKHTQDRLPRKICLTSISAADNPDLGLQWQTNKLSQQFVGLLHVLDFIGQLVVYQLQISASWLIRLYSPFGTGHGPDKQPYKRSRPNSLLRWS